jgi:hypothetical protein
VFEHESHCQEPSSDNFFALFSSFSLLLLLLLLLFNPVPKRNAGASSSGGGGGGGGGGSGRAPSSFSSLDGCGGISRRRLFSFLNYFINCDDADDDDVFLSLFSVDVEHTML